MSHYSGPKAPYAPRICPQCGNQFIPTSPRQKFDRQECRKAWEKIYQRQYQQKLRDQIKQEWEDTTPL